MLYWYTHPYTHTPFHCLSERTSTYTHSNTNTRTQTPPLLSNTRDAVSPSIRHIDPSVLHRFDTMLFPPLLGNVPGPYPFPGESGSGSDANGMERNASVISLPPPNFPDIPHAASQTSHVSFGLERKIAVEAQGSEVSGVESEISVHHKLKHELHIEAQDSSHASESGSDQDASDEDGDSDCDCCSESSEEGAGDGDALAGDGVSGDTGVPPPMTPRFLLEDQIWAFMPVTLPDKVAQINKYNKQNRSISRGRSKRGSPTKMRSMETLGDVMSPETCEPVIEEETQTPETRSPRLPPVSVAALVAPKNMSPPPRSPRGSVLENKILVEQKIENAESVTPVDRVRERVFSLRIPIPARSERSRAMTMETPSPQLLNKSNAVSPLNRSAMSPLNWSAASPLTMETSGFGPRVSPSILSINPETPLPLPMNIDFSPTALFGPGGGGGGG
eukprot:GDKI01005907.1.p1 GENE.GDKI01005907.1~~GDKI01005907.1.p1  ORF type:complete len:446 (+),score=93.17 GDKI01005907.1:178-1515(+)